MWCAVMCCDTSLHKLKLSFLPQGNRIQVQSNTCTWKVCRLDTYPFVTPLIPLRGDTFVAALWAPLSFLGPRKQPHKKPGAHKQAAMPLPHPSCQAPDNTHQLTRWNQLMSQPKLLVWAYTYLISYLSIQIHTIWDNYCIWSYQSHKTNCGMKGQNPPT